MKDYYQILGISSNANQKDVKSTFRKLAFKYHPDTNPGNEKQAEEKFKEINEAYGVLGDKGKRQQYDLVRNGQFTSYQGFQYSQQDIFKDIFSNRAMAEEISRMFAQANLRFDQDFLNRVFFQDGQGYIFHFSPSPSRDRQSAYHSGDKAPYQQPPSHKQNWVEKLLSKIVLKLGRYMVRKLFTSAYKPLPEQNLDQHIELEISPTEAAAGGEKQVKYKRGRRAKRLMVKIPPSVKAGTKIKLRGMGTTKKNIVGDLYLHIRIKS